MDLDDFSKFLIQEAIHDAKNIDPTVVRLYLTELYNKNLSRRTVSRILSCLRGFYKFLERENIVDSNPFMLITLPKVSKPLPGFLYEEELVKLFEINDLSDPLGQRDQADRKSTRLNSSHVAL